MRTLVSALAISAGLFLHTVPLDRSAGEWRMSGAGFHAGVVSQNCWKDETCVLLSAPETSAGGYGSLYKTVSADRPGARRFRFRAAVRVEGPNTRARLWLRFEGNSIRHSGDITADGWAYYQIDTEIPPESGPVTVGLMLSGPGKAWIEDASFTPVKEGRPARRHVARVWHI
jgi:hypothetical protein